MNLDRLKARLSIDEGNKAKPYTDTVGKLTIGVGRNLTDRGLSPDEVNYLLANDIAIATSDAKKLVTGFDSLDDVRQEVLVNMAFNLGIDRLRGFKKFLAAVNTKDFAKSSVEMLDSLWAKQVGARANRLSKAMLTGSF